MSFDRLAPFYRWMERMAAGPVLQRCRTAHLEAFAAANPQPAKILLAGEGHGRFLPVCLARFPNAQITVLEESAGMLAAARASLTQAGLAGEIGRRVRLIQTNILAWRVPPEEQGSYDLIVTHFFLDCFTAEQIPQVVERLAESAGPRAHWLLADFRAPQGEGVAGLRARIIVGILYAFFRRVTRIPAQELVSPDLALGKSGFSLTHAQSFDWGLLTSQLWQRDEPNG